MKKRWKKTAACMLTAMLACAVTLPVAAAEPPIIWGDPSVYNLDGRTRIPEENVTYDNGLFTISETTASALSVTGVWIDDAICTDAVYCDDTGYEVLIKLKPRLLASLGGGEHTIRVEFLNYLLEMPFTTYDANATSLPNDEPTAPEDTNIPTDELPDSVSDMMNPNTGPMVVDASSPMYSLFLESKWHQESSVSLLKAIAIAICLFLGGLLLWAIVPRKRDSHNG